MMYLFRENNVILEIFALFFHALNFCCNLLFAISRGRAYLLYKKIDQIKFLSL